MRVTGRLSYHKVLGTKNPSDILTKHVPADLLAKHLETIGAGIEGGRAESAPELNIVEVESWVQWLSPEDEQTERTRTVSFAAKVRLRAIPSDNKGRKCKGSKVGRASKVPEGAGGVSQRSAAKERWADMADEEEEGKKKSGKESGKESGKAKAMATHGHESGGGCFEPQSKSVKSE